jgi:hypothetical protein
VAVITTVGSAALGMTWGWLLGMAECNVRQPFKTFSALVFATLLVAAEVLVLASAKQIAAFAAAALVTLLLHIGWRRDLRLDTDQNKERT